MSEVKKIMDEPMVLSATFKRRSAQSTEHLKDVARFRELINRPDVKKWEFTATPRELFSILGVHQGRTSSDLWLLGELAKSNAAALRAKALPTLKASSPAAASDLEEALKSIEAGKALDRPAQDRFSRLAKY